MPEPRLMAIVTALMLLIGPSPLRADYDIDQLRTIEGLILAKDCGGLWRYLVANPSIMAGEDPLARELRVFLTATERGQINCFSANAAPVAPPPADVVVSFVDADIY